MTVAAEGIVHVGWYGNARVEAEAIASELHRLHDLGTQWSDMAVLFRKNKDISLVRDALEEHEVPLQVANLGGLLGIPEIVEIRSWLRILADPEDAPGARQDSSRLSIPAGILGSRTPISMGSSPLNPRR